MTPKSITDAVTTNFKEITDKFVTQTDKLVSVIAASLNAGGRNTNTLVGQGSGDNTGDLPLRQEPTTQQQQPDDLISLGGQSRISHLSRRSTKSHRSSSTRTKAHSPVLARARHFDQDRPRHTRIRVVRPLRVQRSGRWSRTKNTGRCRLPITR